MYLIWWICFAQTWTSPRKDLDRIIEIFQSTFVVLWNICTIDFFLFFLPYLRAKLVEKCGESWKMSAVEYGEFRQTKQKQNGADIFYSNITWFVCH